MEVLSNIEFRTFENMLVHLGSLIADITYDTLKYFEALFVNI
jgi:hypothetical protein